MWRLGHAVREIERSHNRVVIEETPTSAAAWLFGVAAFGTLSLLVTRPRSPGSTLAEEAVGASAFLFFGLLALYASVRSTYIGDRPSGRLIIERRIFFSTIRTAYDSHTINRVYVRHTRKGSGLYLHFKSGQTKRLSMSLESIPLEGFATMLNSTLDTHRERD
jgi:hypothetical protein